MQITRISNLPSTAAANLSGVLKLLFIVLILLVAMPLMAQQSKQNTPRKQSWRVIDEAPYRIIPAHPQLKTNGETLKELGFDSIEGLLSGVDNLTSFKSVAFSPDGALIATGSVDNTVRLWDVPAKMLVHTFEGHTGWVSSVAFSPDGALIATGSADNTVRLWDVPAKMLVHTFEGHTGWVSSVAFSPDGALIATGSEDNTVGLWDVQAKMLLHTFEGHTASVTSVAFSPDGALIASGSWDNTVRLWDVPAKTLLHTFEGHTNSVSSVAFSPGGVLIASGSEDNTVRLWDVPAKTLVHIFKGHTASVSSVAFSPGGVLIGTASEDNTVRLWDVPAKTLVHTFKGHTASVSSVAFSPGGALIATASDDNILRLWDVPAKTLVHTFEGHTASVFSVAFSPDGALIATASDDNIVRLWDVQTKTLVHTFEGHTASVSSVAFSPPDGALIATASDDNIVRLWDVQAKTLEHTFKEHTASVSSVAFSPYGTLIATASDDNTVRLWDVQTKSLVHRFEGHTASVFSVAFSPNGALIATASGDNTVRLWDVQTESLVHTFEGHTAWVFSVASNPDGPSIATGSGDNTVRLWDVETESLVHTFEGHTASVFSVAFSPDGALIATASDDNTVRLWDVQAKTLVHTFKGHTDAVNSVAFSPDGALIASGSGDNTVRLWDVQAKTVLQTLVAGNNGNWLSIDKQQQVFRGVDGTLLKKQTTKNGNWQPVAIADMSESNNFSISVAPESMTIVPGESKEVRIQVTNSGSHPAYWLHLRPSTSDDEAIRLDSPNNLFKGKGKQVWKPARIAKLEPGDTATLYARVTLNLKLLAAFVSPGVRRLVLAVVSANNTVVSQTINVDVQSPNLEWQRALLEQDGKTLKIQLQNSGTAALRNFTLDLYAREADSAGHTSAQPLSQQTIQELAPAAVNELAVVLPDGIDLKSQQLTLQGRTRQLPFFSWNLPAPDIERAVRWLYWILAPLLLLILITLFYLRRYRHPLVVRLSNEPALLLKLPPEQLQDACIRLQQTRRLDQIMSEAEVTHQTLSQAVTFIKGKAPQEKAQWLAKRLGTAAKNLQPALWELRLPDNFPLNLDRCLLYFPTAGSEPKALFNDLKAIEQTRMRATLLIGPDSEYQRKLHDKTKDRTNKLVAPSGSELTHLLLSLEPEIVLAKILADQLTLTQLSPYQLGGGVNRESVFFGRQEIISHIMNRDSANYLVVSGRQLGKSSLLKALERRYLEQPDITCRYLVLASEVLVPRLASELGLSHETELEQIAAYLAERKGRFLFLIDEADKFVRFERETDYQILDALRRMSEEGHCAFILAGFWELYEHAVLDYQSPLKNFAEIVQIGELETEACRQLATRPMQNMRLEYASPDLVDQLLEATGQRANLMAIACDQILKQLKANQRIIEAVDVQRSLYNDKTLNALKGWGAMTDDRHACRLDRIVVYATVHKDRFDLAELVEILNQHGLKPDGPKMDHSLARLELGFVLGRDDGGNYFYRVPLFREMIMKEDPAVRLKVELDAYR